MKKCRFISAFFITIKSFSQPDKKNSTNKKSEENLSVAEQNLSIADCRKIAYDFVMSEDAKEKSIRYFEYILKQEKKLETKDIGSLAKAYYFDNQFTKAINFQTQYIDLVANGKLKREAKKQLELYIRVKKYATNSKNIQLINLGSKINSKYAETNPAVSIKENILVYSSKRNENYNIYISEKKPNKTSWKKSKLAGGTVNTSDDEFVAGLSDDGKFLLVHYNENSGFEDIIMNRKVKGGFREADNFGVNINSVYKEEGACFSKSGDTLFFASNRIGGFGGLDLYYSLKISDESWGEPVNMGPDINTLFDENYPSFNNDGSKLYFASKGHNSIGGYDIFYSKKNNTGEKWITPQSIGWPINNAYDNKSIWFTNNPRYAYTSSNMKQGMGSYDIYKVVFLDKEADFFIC
ncbi:MAG: hypothetical protein B6I20_01360 [Bacteroidetes bacterium 4572_117]|nr:MAG: hypothetical protein B6I20_01360 [Bacteroidetes bacterium 4572_117]